MKTIIALYDQRRTAVRAVRELLAHGIPRDRISFVSPALASDAGRSHLPLDDDDEAAPERPRASDGSGPVMVGMPDASPPHQLIGVGATLGIGSVLLGVAFLSLPAIGPVLAAGPMLAGIAVSGAGASGDLPQRLSASGMPPADADRYVRAIARGGVLVAVTLTDEHVEDAAIILARHNPVEPTGFRDPAVEHPSARVQARYQAPRPPTSSAARPY